MMEIDAAPADTLVDVVDAVSQAAAAAVADAVAQAVLAEQPIVDQQQSYLPADPETLPAGWVKKLSQSQPNCFYYFNYEAGLSTWQRPNSVSEDGDDEDQQVDDDQQADDLINQPSMESVESTPGNGAEEKDATSSNKRSIVEDTSADSAAAAPPAAKRTKTTPKEVRVLHILKKHKDSRKPSSWRVPHITQTLEQARVELSDIISLLQEVQDHPEELRATFQELARTESDCSSAKRGGDLGFFGPRKMQPAFEKASFALEIGEMSGLVETSSGVHTILRIG
ncbi:hypothetical protein MPSEU_000992200 [Mayamaea pseudoterrestris]|nr:hypothetical protein MPSEU_000992200 [Mayamaea pseudoterrestris]